MSIEGINNDNIADDPAVTHETVSYTHLDVYKRQYK